MEGTVPRAGWFYGKYLLPLRASTKRDATVTVLRFLHSVGRLTGVLGDQPPCSWHNLVGDIRPTPYDVFCPREFEEILSRPVPDPSGSQFTRSRLHFGRLCNTKLTGRLNGVCLDSSFQRKFSGHFGRQPRVYGGADPRC